MHIINPSTDRVIITGAAGRIGSMLRDHLRPIYRNLLLIDVREILNPTENEECVVANISDRAAMGRLMEGCRALVHLGGAGEGDLEALFQVNVRGMFNVFEMARLEGVKRIVFASSNHTFGCYSIKDSVKPDMPPRPDSLYGAFKVWGEIMLRTYYERYHICSVSLRIGSCRALPDDQRSLATWLSPRDVSQLVDLSLRHPDPGCLVVNGYSNNTRIKTTDPNWSFLGYKPQDDAETYVSRLRGLGVDVDGPWEWNEHGGPYAHSDPWPARPSSGRGEATPNTGLAVP